jgi:hypothetical protein
MWDTLCPKWQRDRFFSHYFGFPLSTHHFKMLRTHLHPYVALTRNTTGKTLQTFKKEVFFRQTGSIKLKKKHFRLVFTVLGWAGWRSRYSDCLRAGRSGDRIPVVARFSAPVQTGREAHPASCTMGTGSFPGVRCGRSVTLTPHPLLVPRSKRE